MIVLTETISSSLLDTSMPVVSAADESMDWIVTLQITETGGSGTIITFGEKMNASDNLDQYDLPEPPAPPEMPYLRSWFETSFTVPFNELLQEYKSSSSNHAFWNISLIWVSAPGNQSNTTINLRWNSPNIDSIYTSSLHLYENGVSVVNMVIENSYSFSTNGSLHRFQIIYQRETGSTNETSFELPILPFIFVASVCIVIIIIAIFFLKRKKN